MMRLVAFAFRLSPVGNETPVFGEALDVWELWVLVQPLWLKARDGMMRLLALAFGLGPVGNETRVFGTALDVWELWVLVLVPPNPLDANVAVPDVDVVGPAGRLAQALASNQSSTLPSAARVQLQLFAAQDDVCEDSDGEVGLKARSGNAPQLDAREGS